MCFFYPCPAHTDPSPEKREIRQRKKWRKERERPGNNKAKMGFNSAYSYYCTATVVYPCNSNFKNLNESCRVMSLFPLDLTSGCDDKEWTTQGDFNLSTLNKI